MSAPSERVEQAAEYLRTVGYRVDVVAMGRWFDVAPPRLKGFLAHRSYITAEAERRGWGGETVSGNG